MKRFDRRDFLKKVTVIASGAAAFGFQKQSLSDENSGSVKAAKGRPSILLVNGDDWGWPFCGAYGEKTVRTPGFDRVAKEGALFTNAYCSAPSSTASRGATLTGKMFYLLEEGSVLYGPLPSKFSVYPDLLEAAGYMVGSAIKGWGPGNITDGGWDHPPSGKGFPDFRTFLEEVPADKPFCFWLGPITPHRPYPKGSGAESGLDPDTLKIPPMLPDSPDVKHDILDYFRGIELADKVLDDALNAIDLAGRYENTIVVVTGDNGLPFPRAKSNLYQYGVHVPMAIRWPAKIKPGRVIEDFISHCDLAPTFLEAAGVKTPDDITGKSLLGVLTSRKSGIVDHTRSSIVTGLECHNPREYFPMRSVRTKKYTYIRNYKPGKYTICDSGPALSYMQNNADAPEVKPLFDLCFGTRPDEELYDLLKDPEEFVNVAENPAYSEIKQKLRSDLESYLIKTKDPRSIGKESYFDSYVDYVKNRPPFNKR